MFYIHKEAWSKVLNDIYYLPIFYLCREFDKLSLEDKTGSESSSTSIVQTSSYGYRGNINSFIRSCKQSILNPSIIEKLRAPFIDLPRNFIESINSYDIIMGLGFRFHPGQSQFLQHELKLPKSFDRLSFLSNSLGLSYNSRALNADSLYSISCSGAGLRGLVTEGNYYSKILVEVITYYNGWYGRFLVLVSLGIGCTVWYGYAPGSSLQAPDVSLFAPIDSYDPFFNMEHYAPGFHRVGFVERYDVSASVESAFVNEPPFADITIPANGPVLKAVGLGVMVVFFLAVGLVPGCKY